MSKDINYNEYYNIITYLDVPYLDVPYLDVPYLDVPYLDVLPTMYYLDV